MLSTEDLTFIEKLLRKSVFPMLALVFVAQVFACRGIYADGANDFLTLLIFRHIMWEDWHRIVNHVLQQAPLVLALNLGAHDLVALRYWFSAWLLVRSLLVWSAAIWNLRNDVLYWPFVLVFAFVYFNTDFFAVGEYGLCFALVAYCFSLLIQPLPQSRIQRVLLLVAAALLSFNYPSALFHSPLLLALVLIKPRDEWNGASTAYKAILVLLFVVSTGSAVWEVLAPRDPANFAAARDPLVVLQDMQLRYTFGYTLLIAASFFVQKNWLRVLVALAALALLFAMWMDTSKLFAFTHYAIRAYVAVMLAVLMVGLWGYRRMLIGTFSQNRVFLFPATLSVLCLGLLSWFDVQQSLDYADYLETFRLTVNNRKGLVPFVMSGLPVNEQDGHFTSGWTYPLMSVILREDASKGIILNPFKYSYQPFDPLNPPDLDRYYH